MAVDDGVGVAFAAEQRQLRPRPGAVADGERHPLVADHSRLRESAPDGRVGVVADDGVQRLCDGLEGVEHTLRVEVTGVNDGVGGPHRLAGASTQSVFLAAVGVGDGD